MTSFLCFICSCAQQNTRRVFWLVSLLVSLKAVHARESISGYLTSFSCLCQLEIIVYTRGLPIENCTHAYTRFSLYCSKRQSHGRFLTQWRDEERLPRFATHTRELDCSFNGSLLRSNKIKNLSSENSVMETSFALCSFVWLNFVEEKRLPRIRFVIFDKDKFRLSVHTSA